MHFFTTIAAVALALKCSAAPSPGKHLVHEKRDGEPHQWERRHRAIANQVLPIRIGLRQRNLENAERYIHDVADPSSPNFGKLALDFSKGLVCGQFGSLETIKLSCLCGVSAIVEKLLVFKTVANMQRRHRPALDRRAGREYFRSNRRDEERGDRLAD